MDGVRVVAVTPYGPIRGDGASALPTVDWEAQTWQGQLFATDQYPFAGASALPQGLASAATF
eukprot:5778008-Lingulodinium_polyedra.AAC.1